MEEDISREISVGEAVEIGAKEPKTAARLLAKNFLKEVGDIFTPTMKQRFVKLFLKNLIDGNLEKEVNGNLLKRIKKLPLKRAMRLLKRYSEEGLKILVVAIYQELRDHQKVSEAEQIDVVNVFLKSLNPEEKEEKPPS